MQTFDKYFERFLYYIIVVLVYAMVLSITLQIISRYVFMHPFSWTEEFARYCMVWATYLGATYIYIFERSGHIIVDFITEILPAVLRRWVYVAMEIVCLLFFAVLTYYGTKLFVISEGVPMIALPGSYRYVYLAAPVNSAIMLFYCFRHIYNLIVYGKKQVYPVLAKNNVVPEKQPELKANQKNS